MTELSREEVLRVARGCGIRFSTTGTPSVAVELASSHVWELERFAAAMYAKGAEDMRERADDAWAYALQSDLERGVKCLNEKAAKDLHQAYPRLAKLGESIRALPITPTNMEAEQAANKSILNNDICAQYPPQQAAPTNTEGEQDAKGA